MALTAADIHNQSFAIDRRGYDVDEVDVFLEHVADEVDAMNQKIADLEAQLDQAHASQSDGFATQVMTTTVTETDDFASETDRDATIADLRSQLAEKRADDNAIAQALIIAQRTADDIVNNAHSQATEMLADAREEAQRILDRANADRQDVVDSIRKLQDDREDAREEYSDLLKDIIADASRKLAEIGAIAAPSALSDSTFAASSGSSAYSSHTDSADMTTGFEIDDDMINLDYTTPQTTDAAVAVATPVASAYEKDLSGFGDVEDTGLDDID